MAQKAGLQVDEAALIRAAQGGDQDAFEQLVRAYDQSVLRLAMNLLRSPEDAHDVYQEAFLRVFRNLNNFRFGCSFHTWLYRIVTNLCLDQLRKRKVRREDSSLVTTPEGTRDRLDSVSEERVDGVEQRPDVAEQCRSVWHAHPPKRPHHDRRDVLEGVLGSGEPGRNDHHKKRQCERAQAREHVAVRESTRKTPAQQVDSGVAMMRARLAGEDREQ